MKSLKLNIILKYSKSLNIEISCNSAGTIMYTMFHLKVAWMSK